MKSYIDKNTKFRAKDGVTDFDKDFFRLMNNSCFVKTIENMRNHVGVRLVTDEWRAIHLAANPNYKHTTIFD